jgi:hypothetical protein
MQGLSAMWWPPACGVELVLELVPGLVELTSVTMVRPGRILETGFQAHNRFRHSMDSLARGWAVVTLRWS